MSTKFYRRKPINSSRSSFVVKVHYNENATWQGEIQWLEGEASVRFRSMQEMIWLMQDAMSKTSKFETAPTITWDEPEFEEEMRVSEK